MAADADADELNAVIGGRSRPAGPFYLLPATTTGFLLLIFVAVETAMLLHPGQFDVLDPVSTSLSVSVSQACGVAALTHSAPVPAQCAAGSQNGVPGELLTVATLLLLTATQYWLAPAWRIRRRRLVPLRSAHDPALDTELTSLRLRALGERRQVTFLLDIVNPTAGGYAFGNFRHRYVVISRGLLTLRTSDPALFHAIVLHEFAHVSNRDLDITAVTLALWRSYVAVILAPLSLGALLGLVVGGMPVQLGSGSLDVLSGYGFPLLRTAQILGLAVLGWLTRYSVLKARELDADARALSWAGGDRAPMVAALRRLFASASIGRSGRSGRSLGALRRRTHPAVATRRAALTDPGPLLTQGFAFSFVLGACFALMMDLSTSLSEVVRTDRIFWPTGAFVLLLAAVLVVRALRAAAYRSTLRSDAGVPPGRRGALGPRAGLALGLPFGWMLTPSRLFDHYQVAFPISVQLAGLLILLAAGWLLALWVEWVAEASEGWVRRSARPLLAALAPATLVGGVLLCCAHQVFFTQADIIVAYVQHLPPTSNPLGLTVGDAQISLSPYLFSGAWIAAAVALLLGVPLVFLRFSGRPRLGRIQVTRRGWSRFWTGVVLGFMALLLMEAFLKYVNLLTLGSVAGSPGFLRMVNGVIFVAWPAATLAFVLRSRPVAYAVGVCLIWLLLLVQKYRSAGLAGLFYGLGLEAAVMGALIGTGVQWLVAECSAVARFALRRGAQ